MTPAELDAVVGGLNPQRLPPVYAAARPTVVSRPLGYIGETEKN